MKRIVVLGGGESGVGTALLALQKGMDVFLSDSGPLKPTHREELQKAGIAFEENGHTEELILSADEVVKSPGIPEKACIVKALRAKGVAIISEIEFASRYTTAKKICITGSNGKTTTTLLTHHLLCESGIRAELAGNVGTSLARQVSRGNEPDWYVIELSSFQLDGMYEFKADIAILTNITPDHLDRYDYKYENYIRSKFRILQNQGENDIFICNPDDPTTIEWLDKVEVGADLYMVSAKGAARGAYYLDGRIIIGNEDIDVDVETMIKGYDAIKERLIEITNKGRDASKKEQDVEESLHVCLEAAARGIKFLNVDLYESEATTFKVKNDTEIIPPFNSIEGLGETVAKNIVEERKKRKFLSIEELQVRAKISETIIETMKRMNIFEGMDESNQLSLF